MSSPRDITSQSIFSHMFASPRFRTGPRNLILSTSIQASTKGVIARACYHPNPAISRPLIGHCWYCGCASLKSSLPTEHSRRYGIGGEVQVAETTLSRHTLWRIGRWKELSHKSRRRTFRSRGLLWHRQLHAGLSQLQDQHGIAPVPGLGHIRFQWDADWAQRNGNRERCPPDSRSAQARWR